MGLKTNRIHLVNSQSHQASIQQDVLSPEVFSIPTIDQRA